MKNLIAAIMILSTLFFPIQKAYAQKTFANNLKRDIQKKIYRATIQSNKRVDKLHSSIGRIISSERLSFDQKMTELENLECKYDKIWENHNKKIEKILSEN